MELSKTQNEVNKESYCKSMISSLNGLENQIRNEENAKNILTFGISVLKETASIKLEDCNDDYLNELKKLSGNA